MDLSNLKVITESDLAEALRRGSSQIDVNKDVLLTLPACEYVRSHSITLVGRKIPETEECTLKAEMIRAGQKLWERQYVDGSGGNISVLTSDRKIICTPALCSKGDSSWLRVWALNWCQSPLPRCRS